MSRLFIPFLTFFTLAGALQADPATPHVDAPAALLPGGSTIAATWEEKLAAFEQATGAKIVIRFLEKSPPADEDQIPGAYMRALSAKLGTLGRGALVVYFADEDDWRIWLGDDSAAAFVGRPGTAQELTKSGAIHETKEAFLNETRATAERAIAATPAKDEASRRQARATAQGSAILAGLMQKLQPR